MSENTAIIEINKAELALERANDIHELLELRDTAAAYEVLANARGFQEAAQKAKIFQLKAERKAGAWLENNVTHEGGNPQLSQDATVGLLPDGVSRSESSRWQLQAKVPEPIFNEWIDDCLMTGKEITASGLREIAKGAPHISFNSGENEWYTPSEYIESARFVMGSIDTDPASSELANKTVMAQKFYTFREDGIIQKWSGNVWMNPPYSQPLISHFCTAFVAKWSQGEFEQGIVLVNNATETGWFQALLKCCTCVCLIKGRIKFIDQSGNPSGAPLQGQTIIYYGNYQEVFTKEFFKYGQVLYARQ